MIPTLDSSSFAGSSSSSQFQGSKSENLETSRRPKGMAVQPRFPHQLPTPEPEQQDISGTEEPKGKRRVETDGPPTPSPSPDKEDGFKDMREVELPCDCTATIPLKGAKWPQYSEGSTGMLSCTVTMVQVTRFKSRASYIFTFSMTFPRSEKSVEVGTIVVHRVLKTLATSTTSDFFREFVHVGKERLRYYDLEGDEETWNLHILKYGAPREMLLCMQQLYVKRTGVLKKCPAKSQGCWPVDQDNIFFIQKIQFGPNYSGKGLLRPALDLMYRAVGSIQRPSPVTGDVCWILEPGYIQNDESRKTWSWVFDSQHPGLQHEDPAWAESNQTEYVVQQLKEVYHYHDFRQALDCVIKDSPHTYMVKRTRSSKDPRADVHVLRWTPDQPRALNSLPKQLRVSKAEVLDWAAGKTPEPVLEDGDKGRGAISKAKSSQRTTCKRKKSEEEEDEDYQDDPPPKTAKSSRRTTCKRKKSEEEEDEDYEDDPPPKTAKRPPRKGRGSVEEEVDEEDEPPFQRCRRPRPIPR